MAIRYFCDHCGEPALTRMNSLTQMAIGVVAVPTILYKGTEIEIIIRKPDKGTDRIDRRREDYFGDICLDCLIDAVRHGELDNGATV